MFVNIICFVTVGFLIMGFDFGDSIAKGFYMFFFTIMQQSS